MAYKNYFIAVAGSVEELNDFEPEILNPDQIQKLETEGYRISFASSDENIVRLKEQGLWLAHLTDRKTWHRRLQSEMGS